jgi:hypothetical protein
MLPEDEEFFDISQRYAFRESLFIPPKVGMYVLEVFPLGMRVELEAQTYISPTRTLPTSP